MSEENAERVRRLIEQLETELAAIRQALTSTPREEPQPSQSS